MCQEESLNSIKNGLNSIFICLTNVTRQLVRVYAVKHRFKELLGRRMYSLSSTNFTFPKEEVNSAEHRILMKIVSLNPRKHANDQCYIKLYKISNKTIVHMIFGNGTVNLILSIIYFVLIKEV